ncbi:flagellar hook-basal body complex protein FliE [Undibacterium sp. SXout11W]|uniref:flagellar hook-basal body complex protein FliE n=1 Tax=Undibacterium sp. SXout11W TaxID=3413050 RepID=UPI003BF31743
MGVAGIDRSQINAMVAQLKTVAAKMEQSSGVMPHVMGAEPPTTSKLNFADALKASLDHVNKVQTDSQKLGEQFALGDDKVSLADVMISMQKASISFQTTVQARNKLVTAYNDIMNMQV